ncbi:MAG: pyridoxamine 5'-phosphate oxidase family protein [Gemmatimonadota bacterium]|nr:pyridoxamine 5'-phosphate oxidase family protein [Gemmatimonadota bacterium]
MAATSSKQPDKDVGVATSTEKKLDDLYSLIEGIETAMFTTRRRDGRLVSRAMQAQPRNAIADLWFVADIGSHKFEELANDPNVNISFFRDRSKEWVSISGVAQVSKSRELIRKLYKQDWKAWFGDEGGERDGSATDPRLALILIDVDLATYLKIDKPRPIVLFEVLKGMITGTKPDIGEERTLLGTEFDS